jgi:hypothetical protein
MTAVPATPVAPQSAPTNSRGDLSNAVRRALESAERDFTVDQIISAAGIDAARRGSVYSALSRMVAANQISKGLAPSTYRARREQRN